MIVQGGEHSHLPLQKTYTVLLSGHSLGLLPQGRAWDTVYCFLPLQFHLHQELSAVCAKAHVLMRVFPWGEVGVKGSKHNPLPLPALLSSHKELMGTR